MTEFTFFASKEDRWGDNMMALWGNLNICPNLNYLELPYHTSGELLSISCLKIWGDIQEPHNNMAYLLVHTGDALGAELQHGPSMDKSPSSLSIHNGGGSRDIVHLYLQWTRLAICSYTAIRRLKSYSPPKDKHIGILPQGKVEESPYGQISQLKVHQLLSTGPQVIYLVGLNGGNQLVTITLPELLHNGSSVTTDEHPHMGIDIPLLSPEEPECTTLPLGGVHPIPAITTPKTPWKPRISLRAEVDALLKWGMADNSSHESEHVTAEKAAAADAVISLSHKVEVSALPIDTSSQANVEEGRLPWRVILSMFLPPWLHTVATVVVQWWTSQNFR